MYEIEAKIKISQHEIESIKKRIPLSFKFIERQNKKDLYFSDKKGVLRIRELNKGISIDIKRQKKKKGLESNQEISIPLGNKEIAIELLKKAGLTELAQKKKQTQLYQYRNFSIEINNVTNIGYFLEIEAIANDKKQVKKAKKELIKLFKQLGFNQSQFDHKYYLEQLNK